MPTRSIHKIAVLLLAAVSVAAGAQQSAPSANPAKQPSPYSHVDLYGGYAFLAPSGNVEGFDYQRINTGAVTSASVYFGKNAGAQVEAGFHPRGYETLKNPYLVPGSDCVYTGQAGPVFRFPTKHLVPFVHVLGGAAKVGGPRFQPCTWGLGMTAGGGLDYIVPLWKNHLAVRVFQIDYEYMRVDFGPTNPYGLAGGKANINALRASAGMVLRLGDLAPTPTVTLECKVTPTEIFAGEPVNVMATLTNFPAQKTVTYRWTSSSLPVDITSPEMSVDTKGLAPGAYNVTAHAYQNGRKQEFASCSASFSVKTIPAPTILCSASPASVAPGDSSTITSIGRSPANRPLKYSYTASAGQIRGTTNTALLTAAGVPPGVITVVCAVEDDVRQKATSLTSLTVALPGMPPPATPQALCTLSFLRDKKRPVRVDNEARACLDDIALTMKHQPEARLAIVGEHSVEETATTAAQRAVNTKAYLTIEKGLDPARVDIRTGSRIGKTLENYLLQPGASFDGVQTAPAANITASREAYSTAASYAAAQARQHRRTTLPKTITPRQR